jgi:hypothetical protein
MFHRLAAITTTLTLGVRQRVARLRAQPDAGLTTAEYLMWIAVVAGIVIAIGAIVATLFTNKANGLSLN